MLQAHPHIARTHTHLHSSNKKGFNKASSSLRLPIYQHLRLTVSVKKTEKKERREGEVAEQPKQYGGLKEKCPSQAPALEHLVPG